MVCIFSSEPAALSNALERLLSLTNRPGLVAVISDFRDQHEWIRPLTAVAALVTIWAIRRAVRVTAAIS